MKKILHVIACLERGGTEAFILNHYREIDHSRFQFDFMVFNEKNYPYLEEIRKLGGNIYFVGAPRIGNLLKFMRMMSEIIRKKGPYSAVHSHVNIANAWIMFVAMFHRIPNRISHSHDMVGKEGNVFARLYHVFQSLLIKLCSTHYVACSNDAGEYLYGYKFFRKKGLVIHNGIRVEEFLEVSDDKIADLKKELNFQEDIELVIGNISRFEAKKNQSFVVDVFKEVVKKVPKSLLLLGGVDGGDLKTIKAKVQGLNLEKNVRFIGVRDDIPVCLKLIDIYLFPSLYEGLGIVLLEAQAAGCYCVASTGVSMESDMGLEKIVYLDLNVKAEEWAKDILDNTCKKTVDRLQVLGAFAEKGYSVTHSLEKLMQLYN